MRHWRYDPPRKQDLGGERFLLAAVRFWERGIVELERSRVELLARPDGYLAGLSPAKRNRSLSAAPRQAKANYRFFLDRLRVLRGLPALFHARPVVELVAAD